MVTEQRRSSRCGEKRVASHCALWKTEVADGLEVDVRKSRNPSVLI